MPPLIIAIDGPAGSGKSTTARAVAERLGYLYLDTGAMYRAVALAYLRAGITDPAAANGAVLDDVHIGAAPSDAGGMDVLLNGENVSGAIREPAVSAMASKVAAIPAVRAKLVDEQRRIGRRSVEAGRGVVLDGRDIGTVVFPDADVKIFLVADPHVRAERRCRELRARGRQVTVDDVLAELEERDRRDQERAVGPLRKAEDAIEVDTTVLTIPSQVKAVLNTVQERNRMDMVE